MTDICVVVPTWDMRRALTEIANMMSLSARRREEYLLVVPKHENLPVGSWVNGLDIEDPAIMIIETDDYLSPVEAMTLAGARLMAQERGVGHSPSDIFLFLHDDVTIEQRAWDRSIIDHFATHPRCGLAGFGGGVGFALDDIYKLPYDYRQLARIDFISNMREAEQHGRRVTVPTQVAALDGFSLAVSRELYERGGYVCPGPSDPTHFTRKGAARGLWDSCLRDGIPFHLYDGWVSCRAAELGFETWMLPVACHHVGGQTSVAREAEYLGVCKRLGYADGQVLYDDGHRKVYERFQRVLPLRVPHKES